MSSIVSSLVGNLVSSRVGSLVSSLLSTHVGSLVCSLVSRMCRRSSLCEERCLALPLHVAGQVYKHVWGFAPHQELTTDCKMHEHAHVAAKQCMGLMSTRL